MKDREPQGKRRDIKMLIDIPDTIKTFDDFRNYMVAGLYCDLAHNNNANDGGAVVKGSAYSKANLLPDNVVEKLGLSVASDPEIKDALNIIADKIAPKTSIMAKPNTNFQIRGTTRVPFSLASIKIGSGISHDAMGLFTAAKDLTVRVTVGVNFKNSDPVRGIEISLYKNNELIESAEGTNHGKAEDEGTTKSVTNIILQLKKGDTIAAYASFRSITTGIGSEINYETILKKGTYITVEEV